MSEEEEENKPMLVYTLTFMHKGEEVYVGSYRTRQLAQEAIPRTPADKKAFVAEHGKDLHHLFDSQVQDYKFTIEEDREFLMEL